MMRNSRKKCWVYIIPVHRAYPHEVPFLHLTIVESGQDVSSRFGPQQTGGSIIQHVRPVDLQASMAQGAEILARWAALLKQEDTAGEMDFAAEAAWWRSIADEFTVKTRLMWQDGWFRDYDAVAREWSSQQDTMHLAPFFVARRVGARSSSFAPPLLSYRLIVAGLRSRGHRWF